MEKNIDKKEYDERSDEGENICLQTWLCSTKWRITWSYTRWRRICQCLLDEKEDGGLLAKGEDLNSMDGEEYR